MNRAVVPDQAELTNKKLNLAQQNETCKGRNMSTIGFMGMDSRAPKP
jgi:hypothetical protein